MLRFLFSYVLILITSQIITAQLNMSEVGSLIYDISLNDVWGYVAPDGTEYALVGSYSGLSIVSLEDPTNPDQLFFLPGANSTWRDIKTWENYAYVSNETGNGISIVDLSKLPEVVNYYNWQPVINNDTLKAVHNLWVDELGVLYITGSNIAESGVIIADIASDPSNPVVISANSYPYSHDVYVRNNIMYSSEIYRGKLAIYDVTDKQVVNLLSDFETSFSFTHNSWLSDDGNTLFTTDELTGAPVGSYDVSDPLDVKVLNQFLPQVSPDMVGAPHNVHVWNDWLVVSYYALGCLIIDISDPTNLVEVGYFDDFVDSQRVWGAYPYLPSNLVLLTDMTGRLIVVEPNYVYGCRLQGNVTDKDSGELLSNVNIEILETTIKTKTSAFGEYKVGYAFEGEYTIRVSKYGYNTAEFTQTLTTGITEILDIQLEKAKQINFSGNIVDSITNIGENNAIVELEFDGVINTKTTNEQGLFTFENLYEGDYGIKVFKWGKTLPKNTVIKIVEQTNNPQIKVSKKYTDSFKHDLGWLIEYDYSEEAAFAIGNPNEEVFNTGFTNYIPQYDNESDDGDKCYFNKNGERAEDNGFNYLTSPVFDIADYSSPILSFDYWLNGFDVTSNTYVAAYPMELIIFNGNETVTQELQGQSLHNHKWSKIEINLKDIISVTNNMKITFKVIASSVNFKVASGIDYFQVYDADNVTNNTNPITKDTDKFMVYPNPSNTNFSLDFDINSATKPKIIYIYDSIGKLINAINLNNNNGSVTFGTDLSKGIYFIKVNGGSYKIVKF